MSYVFFGATLREDSVEGAQVPAASGPVLAVDLDRCIACRACEVHCQVEHALGANRWLMHVRPFPAERGPEPLGLPFGCAHCSDAPCAAVCPTGAIRRREDGVVVQNQPECIGCRLCIVACPYGAPRYDDERRTVVKCDLCAERLDQGLWPACATKCSMKAIHLLDAERLARILGEVRRRGAGMLVLGARPSS